MGGGRGAQKWPPMLKMYNGEVEIVHNSNKTHTTWRSLARQARKVWRGLMLVYSPPLLPTYPIRFDP